VLLFGYDDLYHIPLIFGIWIFVAYSHTSRITFSIESETPLLYSILNYFEKKNKLKHDLYKKKNIQ